MKSIKNLIKFITAIFCAIIWILLWFIPKSEYQNYGGEYFGPLFLGLLGILLPCIVISLWDFN
jgi:hypothetical protein